MAELHKPTDEQLSVMDAVGAGGSSGGPSVMVDALAGCTKSYTLRLAAPLVRTAAMALAFNKRNAEELKPLLPPQFVVKTFNGLGHGAWMRANPGVSRWEVDDKKLGKLVSQSAKDIKVQLSSDQWDGVRRLVTGAMQRGLTLGDEGKPMVSDTREEWEDIAAAQWLPQEDFDMSWDLAKLVLKRSVELARQGKISFDDQVYCSACLGGRFPQYPTVFVDEKQDLSPLNHQQLGQSLAADGRIVAVGDDRQAIYSFRGADAESSAKIRRLRGQWTDRRLTMTFRCPKVVVAMQQEHAPGFRAAPSCPEGRFARLRAAEGAEEWGGWSWLDVQKEAAAIGPRATITVICRNNGPIFSLAFKLLRQGIGVQVLGSDMAKGLKALSRKLAAEDSTPADAVREAIAEWELGECSLAMANGHEERCDGISDRAACLMAVLDSAGVVDAGGLRVALDRLFMSTSPLVKLSSIHKIKGAESDLVVFLDRWRCPSPQAKKALAAGNPVPMQQELNLAYVGDTRTRHTLIYADLRDFVI